MGIILIWTITEGVSIFHNDGDVYMYPNDQNKSILLFVNFSTMTTFEPTQHDHYPIA